MKVVCSAVAAKLGGAERYIQNLAQELARCSASDDYYIFLVPEKQASRMRGLAPNITVIGTEIGSAGAARRLYFDQVELPALLRKLRADLLYSTANLGTLRCPCPQILLVRNSLYFSRLYERRILKHLPVTMRIENLLRRKLVAMSARAADCVLTPSDSLRQELHHSVRFPLEKVVVNPYGTRLDRFAPRHHIPWARNPNSFRLLHVSHYADHKNLGVVFRAIAELVQTGIPGVTLSTTANPEDPRCVVSCCRIQDLRLLADPVIRSRVRSLGDTPQDALPDVYLAHDAFVFPSLVESYGHPLVEAMASGVPVLAADLGYAREVCGDAALYFDPFSAADLSARIRQLMTDRNLWADLRRRGLERARQQRWEDHVSRLLSVFRQVVDQRRGRQC